MLALGLWFNRKADNFPISFWVSEKKKAPFESKYIFQSLQGSEPWSKTFLQISFDCSRLSERLQIPAAPSGCEVQCGAYKRTSEESSGSPKALNAAQPARAPHIAAPVALAVTALGFWETAPVSGFWSLFPSWLQCMWRWRLDVLLAGRSPFIKLWGMAGHGRGAGSSGGSGSLQEKRHFLQVKITFISEMTWNCLFY